MRIRSNLKRFFRAILPLILLAFLANCAGGNEKNMEELLSNDGTEELEEGEANLLSEDDGLMADLFDENESDSLTGDTDFPEEEEENSFSLTENFEEEEEEDNPLSMENPSELDDMGALEEEMPSEIAPVELKEFKESEGRVVRYIKEDCDIYDASKMNVIGSFKKGEPVVVTINMDGWATLDASHFIKAEYLSKKGVARVR